MKNIIKNTFTALFALVTLAGFTQAETLKSGSWTKKDYKMTGTWKITEEGGTKKLIITDLKTKKAPDLKIFFSPKSISEVTSKTATDGSFFLKDLTSHKGTQTYTLPADFDLSKYKSLLVHCKKFTKLWGGANL